MIFSGHHRGRIAARLRCERGLTLIELLVAMMLALVVVVGPLLFIVTSIRQQNVVASRTAAARHAETGLEQLVRDLRQAMPQDASGNPLHVTVSNPTGTTTAISFDIPTAGSDTTPRTLVWTCPSAGASTWGTCTRTLAGSAQTVIAGVNSAVFAATGSGGTLLTLPATDPAYIGVTLSLQVISQLDRGQSHTAPLTSNAIKVQTGVDLRNFA